MRWLLTWLYKMCVQVPPDIDVDAHYVEMIKLQHSEVLDKIDELIALVNTGMKGVYIAVVAITLLALIQVGLGVVLTIILLNK